MPGETSEPVEADTGPLQEYAQQLLQSWDIRATAGVAEDCVHDLCRFGGTEPPAVAAFMGGVGSQEVIKLITHQYVPCQGTFVFDGVHSTSAVIDV